MVTIEATVRCDGGLQFVSQSGLYWSLPGRYRAYHAFATELAKEVFPMPTITLTLTLDVADAEMLRDLVARGCVDLTHSHTATWLQRQQADRVAGTALEAVNRALQTEAQPVTIDSPNAWVKLPGQHPDLVPARMESPESHDKTHITWVFNNQVHHGSVPIQRIQHTGKSYVVLATDIELMRPDH